MCYNIRNIKCYENSEPGGFWEQYHKRTENRKRKILIIDNEKISCSVLKRILENRYDILTAGNGQEALEIMNEQKYEISLILLET